MFKSHIPFKMQRIKTYTFSFIYWIFKIDWNKLLQPILIYIFYTLNRWIWISSLPIWVFYGRNRYWEGNVSDSWIRSKYNKRNYCKWVTNWKLVRLRHLLCIIFINLLLSTQIILTRHTVCSSHLTHYGTVWIRLGCTPECCCVTQPIVMWIMMILALHLSVILLKTTNLTC